MLRKRILAKSRTQQLFAIWQWGIEEWLQVVVKMKEEMFTYLSQV